MSKSSLISRYFDKAAPGKGTAARRLIAGQLRSARHVLGRKKVRSGLLKNVKSDIRHAKSQAKSALSPEKMRRLRKTSHKITISPGINIRKKRVASAVKPKTIMAGAGGRKVRNPHKAAALQTKSITAGRSRRSSAAFHTQSYTT